MVFLADAEVASSADRLGVASPADHAEVLPLVVAEVASSAIAEVASSADFAEAASSAVAEVASEADPVGLVDPYGTFGVGDDDSSLAPQDCIVDCGNLAEVAFLDNHDVGGLAEVMFKVPWKVSLLLLCPPGSTARVVISHWGVSVFRWLIPKSLRWLLWPVGSTT